MFLVGGSLVDAYYTLIRDSLDCWHTVPPAVFCIVHAKEHESTPADTQDYNTHCSSYWYHNGVIPRPALVVLARNTPRQACVFCICAFCRGDRGQHRDSPLCRSTGIFLLLFRYTDLLLYHSSTHSILSVHPLL